MLQFYKLLIWRTYSHFERRNALFSDQSLIFQPQCSAKMAMMPKSGVGGVTLGPSAT